MSLRTAKKQQTRLAIIEAAGRLLAAGGFEATTMRDIAAAANLSYQTLYNYYPTKALVIQAVLVAEVGDVAAQASQIVEGYQGELLATLHELSRLRFNVVEKHDRTLWREVVIETLRQQREFIDIYREIDANSLDLVQGLLVQAQRCGHLDATVDARALAKIIFSLGELVFLEYVMDGNTTAIQALAELETQLDLVVTPHLLANG